MNPMLWNDLPSIQEAAGLDDSDERCLQEIKTVVEKHGKTHRFGAVLPRQLRKSQPVMA